MKKFIVCIILLALSSVLTSCANTSCGIEVGLTSSAGCETKLGTPPSEAMARYLEEVLSKNYQMFYYTKHEDVIDKAKSCANAFFKKDDIRKCSSVVDILDRYCFDDKDFTACQYLYEIQSEVYKNQSYLTKVENFAKGSKLPISKDNHYFFPVKDNGDIDRCQYLQPAIIGNDINSYLNSRAYNNYMNCIKKQTSLNMSSNDDSILSILYSLYGFASLDSDINGEITWSELASFVEKVDKIIESHGGTSGSSEELEKLGINRDILDMTTEVFSVCNQGKSPMPYKSLDACNMPDRDKKTLKELKIFKGDYVNLSEVLSIRFINLYKTASKYSQYQNLLSKP